MRAFLVAVCLMAGSAFAQDEPEALEGTSFDDLKGIVERIDPEAQSQGNGVQFTVVNRTVLLVCDPEAGRMRLMTPITAADGLPETILERMLQANFDSALDARYAIAQGQVWSTFIHPLPSLTEADFLSGIAQTVTAAETFGISFTSGQVVFGGGDSEALNQRLLEQFEEALGDPV